MAWIPVAVFIAAIPVAISFQTAAKTKLEHDQANLEIAGLFALASVTLILWPFVFAAFKAIEWKWWVDSMSFGAVRLGSDLKRGALIGTYWKLIGIGYLVLLIGLILISVFIAAVFLLLKFTGIDMNGFAAQMKAGHFSWGLFAAGVVYVLSYLGLLQAIGIVRRIYLIQRIWKIVVSSITAYGLDAAEHVLAEGEAASAFGEGLADGLDLAGF